jgi:hypothetical protein|tara:strand:+ start:29 stop:355 length:327 start_codon:yes stop_codon:yes gene_type:complete
MSSFKDMPEFDDMRPKMSQKERDEKMKKFLEKGGKVEKLKPGYPINVGSFDRTRKPAFSKEDIEKGVTGKAPMPNYDTYKPGSYHDFDVGGDNPPEYIKPTKNEPPIK